MNALAAVTQSGGTAAGAFAGFPLFDVPVAGKTGTARRPPFQDTSWFAAMVPRERPAVRDRRDDRTGRARLDVGGADRPPSDRGMYGIDSAGVVDGGVTD